MIQLFKLTWYHISILGCALLLLGIFSPIVTFDRGPEADKIGLSAVTGPTTRYYLDIQTGNGDGVMMALPVIISLLLIRSNRKRWLILTGAIATALLLVDAISLWSETHFIPDMSRYMTAQWNYGWFILIIGSLLVLGAGLHPVYWRKTWHDFWANRPPTDLQQ